MKNIRRLGTIVAAATVATMTLAACSSGSGSSSGSSTSGTKSIKVVIADYSKDHTAAFWNAFATKYEATTGIKMNLQIISWNDLDQQSSTMVQTGDVPDILNENAYASYAADGLLYNSDEVLSPAVKADIHPRRVIPAWSTRGLWKTLGSGRTQPVCGCSSSLWRGAAARHGRRCRQAPGTGRVFGVTGR